MKALKKITNFNGEDDVERWIGKFELAIELDGKEDKESQILCMFLSDAAYDVFNNLSENEKGDASAIKGALRNAFGLRRIDAWRAALSKKIHVGDSLDVAGDEIKKFFKVVCEGGAACDYVTGVILLDSLPTNIREQVMLQIGNDLHYSNVLHTAKKIWPTRSESGACAGFQAQSTQNNSGGLNSGSFKRGEIIPNSSDAQKRFLPRCIGCKRIGHIRRDCRTVCHKCNQIGHVARDCAAAVPLNLVQGATANPAVPHQTLDSLQQRPPQ